MKELCLLALVVASAAGCANTSEPATAAKRERLSRDQITVGSRIPRKLPGQEAVPTAQVDKQALENERMTGAAVINGK